MLEAKLSNYLSEKAVGKDSLADCTYRTGRPTSGCYLQALIGYFMGDNVAHTAIKPTIPLVATILFPPHHKHGNGSHSHHHKSGPPAVALAGYLPSKFEVGHATPSLWHPPLQQNLSIRLRCVEHNRFHYRHWQQPVLCVTVGGPPSKSFKVKRMN